MHTILFSRCLDSCSRLTARLSFPLLATYKHPFPIGIFGQYVRNHINIRSYHCRTGPLRYK